MNEDVDKYVFDKIFDDNLPSSSPGVKKRYQMRQLSFKNGNESDSSLESVDLNISTDVSINEFQKSESPKILDENVNFNNSKGLYSSRDIFSKGRSFDKNNESNEEKQAFEKFSSNYKTKNIKKQSKSQLLTENFDNKRFTLPTSKTIIRYSPTNTPSPTSSSTNSPSSTTSHNTFQLSPDSSHRNSVFDDLLFEIYNRSTNLLTIKMYLNLYTKVYISLYDVFNSN